jgi:hypothetical protein
MLNIDRYLEVVEDIKLNGLKAKTKAQLEEIRGVLITQHQTDLSMSSAGPFIVMVENEIAARSRAVADLVLLWAAVIAAIFAVIAALPIVRDWFPKREHGIPSSQPGGKDASSRLPQSNSPPPAPTKGK